MRISVNLDNIAKQWVKITNKEILQSYNDGKIVNFNDISDIKILKQSKSHTFIMMTAKTKTPSKIDLLIEEFRSFKKDVTTRLDKIESRLDWIVKLNNLKE